MYSRTRCRVQASQCERFRLFAEVSSGPLLSSSITHEYKPKILRNSKARRSRLRACASPSRHPLRKTFGVSMGYGHQAQAQDVAKINVSAVWHKTRIRHTKLTRNKRTVRWLTSGKFLRQRRCHKQLAASTTATYRHGRRENYPSKFSQFPGLGLSCRGSMR